MFRSAFSTARPLGRRFFSGEAFEAEHHASTQSWKKRTLFAIPVVGALAVANVFIHLSHHHEAHSEHLYSYQKKLVKVSVTFICLTFN